MLRFILFFTAIMIFAVSCQKSDLIEETMQTDEQMIIESNGDLEDRARKTTDDQFGKIDRKGHFIQNNIWGASTSQKVYSYGINSWGVVSADHKVGSGNVKSYPGIVIGTHYGHSVSNKRGLPKKVNNLGRMNCVWNQSNTMSRGNVSMDLWFHPSKSHGTVDPARKELMIWTWRKNQRPISDTAIPFATKKFNGKKYKIYKGNNGNGSDVYTFIQVNNSGKFNGNIKPFVKYCVDNGWVPNDWYMLSFQAGWEMISGGTTKTTKFNLSGI